MRVFINLELEPEEFHIYIYTKSYFYKKLMAGRLQYLSVKRGQYMKAHLSMQVKYRTKIKVSICNSYFQQLENLPILDMYKFTLPNGTPDCQNDPAYDRDQVHICMISIYKFEWHISY